MSSPPPTVRQISAGTVKPPPAHRQLCHLTSWDLPLLSIHYTQKGLLFSDPRSLTADDIADRLKASLSTALHHFYPLAGRLVVEEANDATSEVSGTYVSVDCNGQGAEFIHATAEDIAISDVLSSSHDVPSFVKSFFPLDRDINFDGHSKPLLAVQLTVLADGLFIGCSFNHAVGDGTSFWQFFNAWAEIARAGGAADATLSRPPVHDRWFIDGFEGPPLKLPLTRNSDVFVERFMPPILRERIFHLSAESIALLKATANRERGTSSTISSFQSVASLAWRSITRARGAPAEQKTSCKVAIQNRSRMRPPLSPEYFGNCVNTVAATTTAGELLSQGFGYGAWLVNQVVAGHTDSAVLELSAAWTTAPWVYNLSEYIDEYSVSMGSSPRFDVYGCDFGWGKPAAARSGSANKLDGKVTFYPGREGGGSMDLEIYLFPESMRSLESDEEFMAALSPLELDPTI